MTNASRLAALTALLLAAAGCGPGGLDDSTTTTATEMDATANGIVGGTTDHGHEAVAMLYYDDGGNSYLCSGTIVDKRVFLTAGHCTDGVASKYYVLGGTGNLFTSDPDWAIGVSSVHQHPSYNPSTLTHDVGVLILDSDAPVTPYRWLDVDAGSEVYAQGTTFTAVGYGVTSETGPDTSGLKRTVDLTMTDIYTDIFEYGSATHNTCSGDSGGPALMVIDNYITVIGTVSYGDQFCQSFGGDSRTDYNKAFIQQYADPDAGRAKIGGSGGGGHGDNPLACSVSSMAGARSPLAAALMALVAVAAVRKRR